MLDAPPLLAIPSEIQCSRSIQTRFENLGRQANLVLRQIDVHIGLDFDCAMAEHHKNTSNRRQDYLEGLKKAGHLLVSWEDRQRQL